MSAVAILTTVHSVSPAIAENTDWVALETAARSELGQGDLDKAESDFKSALSNAEQSAAIEPGVVNCLCGLALVYHRRGNVAESERLYELAMRNLESLVGPSSPRYADYMPDLAWLYNEHGKPDKAEVLFKNALSIRHRTYGDDDPGSVPLMLQYAKFLRANGRQAEASQLEILANSITQKQSP